MKLSWKTLAPLAIWLVLYLIPVPAGLQRAADRIDQPRVLAQLDAEAAGIEAAAEHRVRSPLAECGFTKADVRALAVSWDLPTWDKPASPCLSSRVAYGEAVSPERLAMIDAAEQHLRSLGLRTVRVRYHAGDLARIEAPVEALAKLCEPVVREALLARLQELGFRYATLDLAGFRSGSLNDVLPLEALRQFAAPGRKR